MINRKDWTDQQWIDDARRLMNEPFGEITSLVNGHVMRMLKRLDSLIEVTTIYVETSGQALTPSLYLGPTDRKAIPEGTYYLMRVDDNGGEAMSRGVLRAALWDLTGGMCEWPNCDEQADEMAHIEPSGMGGRASVDTIGNVWALCRGHHDILDGRPTQMKSGRAVRDLAAAYVQSRRSMIEELTP